MRQFPVLVVAAAVATVATITTKDVPQKLNHWYPWRVNNQVIHSQDPARTNIDQISQARVRARAR